MTHRAQDHATRNADTPESYCGGQKSIDLRKKIAKLLGKLRSYYQNLENTCFIEDKC